MVEALESVKGRRCQTLNIKFSFTCTHDALSAQQGRREERSCPETVVVAKARAPIAVAHLEQGNRLGMEVQMTIS